MNRAMAQYEHSKKRQSTLRNRMATMRDRHEREYNELKVEIDRHELIMDKYEMGEVK